MSGHNCRLTVGSARLVATLEFHPDSPRKGDVVDGLYYAMTYRLGSYENAKTLGTYGNFGIAPTGAWLQSMIHVEK